MPAYVIGQLGPKLEHTDDADEENKCSNFFVVYIKINKCLSLSSATFYLYAILVVQVCIFGRLRLLHTYIPNRRTRFLSWSKSIRIKQSCPAATRPGLPFIEIREL